MARNTQSTINLIEEATHLLRRSPVGAWLCYYVGSVPLVAYLFYFWSDMSRSALASSHVIESSLLLALLYWWMKVWQAIYAGQLLSFVEGKTENTPMKKRGWLRLITSQAWIHATMPWVLPLSFVAMLPFGWAYAFYQNISVLADEHFREGGRTKQLVSRALTQSHYLPMQNHSLLLLLLITALLVYLNLLIGFILATTLAKSFTGMENDFTRQPWLYLSTPVQMLIISGSYLVMGPLLKALYVLRCFYGQARKSGADLQVQLRQLQTKSTAAITTLVAFGLLLLQPPCVAQTIAAPPAATRASELDRSIKDVLAGSEYQWRFPREAAAHEDSWLGRQISEITAWFNNNIKIIARYCAELLRWIFGGGAKDEAPTAKGDSTFVSLLPTILYTLIALLFIVLGVMIYRSWKQSRKNEPATADADAAADINLESENVIATQLPENEWLRLAREKMQTGELRLALRALFLATLAHLGEKNFIAITRSKSNGDYQRELGWRARGRDEVTAGFSEQVLSFDRVWYGWHDVDTGDLARFQEQHERITAHAT